MKLLQVDTVDEAKNKIDYHFNDIKLKEEEVNIIEALGRVLAEDVYSPIDLPEYNRSTVDGYAVISKDIFGASESLPIFLEFKGKIDMGESTELVVNNGDAIYVPTGAMIPPGADGVVMIEYVEELDSKTIAVYRPTAPGDGIIQRSEDVKKGTIILPRGKKIKSQDIGSLAAVGIKKIKVFEKPKVAIISTGDEIVEPSLEVQFGKVRDINTYALASMVKELGGKVTYKAVVEDDFSLLQSTMESLLEDNHIVIVSGGSSVGTKDVTAKAIDSLGKPGVFVHGVAVKPGKPTIIGRVGDTAAFGLPGHPVSAIIVFKIFVEYLINKLTSKDKEIVMDVHAISQSNIHSAPGKETYQMVILQENGEDYLAKPIHGKSGAISLLTNAHGYIKIPTNKEGIKKGEKVRVCLL